MVTTLARQLGIALLAISMIAAPVVGAQPRCCKTGAVKGSGQCCCGPQAAESEAPSCCEAEARPCCASAEETPEPDALPAFADAPCQCKASSQPPAIPSGKQNSEISLDIFVALGALPALADASQQALIARGHAPLAARGGTALHKVHCRWTI